MCAVGCGPTSAPDTLRGVAGRRLRLVAQRAEIVQPGVTACPLGFDESVFLRFTAATGRRPLARATEHPTGAHRPRSRRRADRPPLVDYPSVTKELLRLGAIPVCGARPLSPSVSPPGRNGPADARIITFSFQNRSTVMCRPPGFRASPSPTPPTARPAFPDPARRSDRPPRSARGHLDLDPASPRIRRHLRAAAATRAPPSTQGELPGVGRRFRFTVGTSRQPLAPCRAPLGSETSKRARRPPSITVSGGVRVARSRAPTTRAARASRSDSSCRANQPADVGGVVPRRSRPETTWPPHGDQSLLDARSMIE